MPRDRQPDALANGIEEDESSRTLAFDEAGATLTEATQAGAGAPPAGERIGPYRLLRRLGEGGMGEVWEAEQLEPVRRRVALKVIKAGLDTKQVVARFEAERQALALMDHPAIARVFDAGSTPLGRPYFAMELIRGAPITVYCDWHKLTMRQRVELFIQVCEGVQHAHQKAIIHRDLKPSNILVSEQDGHPVPKIIDFGVAKATAQSLTDTTMYTQLGIMVGTPEYMSPEQAASGSEDVDTRSDVYSLGAVLYELLVGAQVLDWSATRRQGYDAMRRRIHREDPKRPSTRISSLGESSTEIAAARRTEARSLIRLMRRDLDWIVMKAIEKERSRRYGSPAELAADLERFLRGEPVVARPPSRLYKARRFVGRHKLAVGIAAVFALTLLGFSTVTALQSRRIRAERDRANLEAETANRVSDFLVDLFEVVDPSEARGNSITAREILDSGAERIRLDLTGQPAVQARIMGTVGAVYQKLGLFDSASELIERGLAIGHEQLGDAHPVTVDAESKMASLLMEKGEYETAEAHIRQALASQRRLFGDDSLEVASGLEVLGAVEEARGRYADAEASFREGLEIRRRRLGDEHADTLSLRYRLGVLERLQGRYEEAEATHRDVLAIQRRVLEEPHPQIAESFNAIGVDLLSRGDYDGAEEMFGNYLAMVERLYPDGHTSIATALENLGNVYFTRQEYARTIEVLERVLRIRRERLGADSTFAGRTIANMAVVYASAGDLDNAVTHYREALDILGRTLGEDHPDLAYVVRNLGILQKRQGDLDAAEASFRRAIEISTGHLGWDNPETAGPRLELAMLYLDQGRHEEAETMLLEVRALLEGKVESDHARWQNINEGLARLYRETGREEMAARYEG